MHSTSLKARVQGSAVRPTPCVVCMCACVRTHVVTQKYNSLCSIQQIVSFKCQEILLKTWKVLTTLGMKLKNTWSHEETEESTLSFPELDIRLVHLCA
jgi:hypothetical protein